MFHEDRVTHDTLKAKNTDPNKEWTNMVLL